MTPRTTSILTHVEELFKPQGTLPKKAAQNGPRLWVFVIFVI